MWLKIEKAANISRSAFSRKNDLKNKIAEGQEAGGGDGSISSYDSTPIGN
jgi:hypothetical protein